MNWQDFCNFWINIGSEIQNWFTAKDSDGLNPLSRLIIAICVLIIGWIFIKLIMKLLRKILGVKNKLGLDVSVKTFSLSVVNAALNIALAIAVLLILKVDFTSVSSILSAGTVAIGLSLQNLISAFASGVVLLKAKHFKTGDYIEVAHSDGKCEGTVSSVGLISTTLETYDNQHIVIPNNKVLEGVITNYTANPTRRVVVPVKIDCSCDAEKALEIMKACARADKRSLNDPGPNAVISEINEYSISLSLRCFVKNRDYWDVYFDLRNSVLLEFKKNGIKFPKQRIIYESNEK